MELTGLEVVLHFICLTFETTYVKMGHFLTPMLQGLRTIAWQALAGASRLEKLPQILSPEGEN